MVNPPKIIYLSEEKNNDERKMNFYLKLIVQIHLNIYDLNFKGK